MATTSYIDFSAAVRGIGARTSAAGAAVTDYGAEEDRLINSLLTEGAITANAFKVNATTGMTLTVGSGSAKTDLYAVAGDVAGQGVYVARLEPATVNVAVPASDPSLTRVDEVYLVVADTTYDAGGLSLPRIGYRKGVAGAGAPGPDAAWKASVKLATVTVAAAAASITAGNVVDNRSAAAVLLKSADSDLLDGLDSTAFLLASGASEEAWHAVGAAGQPAFSSGASNSGSGYQPLQFKKVGNTVRIRGVVSAISTVFTLPSGYRPPTPMLFPVVDQFGSIGYGQILANGDVSLNKFGGGGMTFAALLLTFWTD